MSTVPSLEYHMECLERDGLTNCVVDIYNIEQYANEEVSRAFQWVEKLSMIDRNNKLSTNFVTGLTRKYADSDAMPAIQRRCSKLIRRCMCSTYLADHRALRSKFE